MLDNSYEIRDASDEAIHDQDIVESDSDLFGESDSAPDQISGDNNSPLETAKDGHDAQLKGVINGYVSNDLSGEHEEINQLNIRRPDKYFGIDDEDRVFLTLKLPERLKVINGASANDNKTKSEMNINGGFDEEGNVYSNSKLVSWSDGTYSLFINNELAYDCVFGHDKAYIFDDSMDQKYKICMGRVDKKLTIRPRAIEKNRLLKDSRSRMMVPTTLEEINQHEVESRKRVEELNAISSIRIQQKKTSFISESKRKQMTSYFLEESSEESA
ncbi:hypothetical protein OIY81_488 [Cryptosporidium canis]|uniref:RNA polymerase-associated protein LEO1 n=1 Tax=Cryptosporidium canis TaxID=195482 RepID=A0ABQ8P781_9CRYT|nr:hypothetical protein OJ252_1834 [Cryptosporidium canis]KAJ1614443.1 hypothetical protein OIY81_488 [Cryptosporidium canis]